MTALIATLCGLDSGIFVRGSSTAVLLENDPDAELRMTTSIVEAVAVVFGSIDNCRLTTETDGRVVAIVVDPDHDTTSDVGGAASSAAEGAFDILVHDAIRRGSAAALVRALALIGLERLGPDMIDVFVGAALKRGSIDAADAVRLSRAVTRLDVL